MAEPAGSPPTLFDILGNSLILRQLAPYLPISSIFALGSVSKPFRDVLYSSPEAFRYLNLSSVKTAQLPDSIKIDVGGYNWRSQRMDEALTEDEFYSGPLRGHFSRLQRKQILRNVQTLILDGLSVTAEMVREIIAEDRFNVRILSIRDAKLVNERTLMQTLKYAVRPTRPEGTPRLKGLYVFGPREIQPAPAPKSSRATFASSRHKQNVDTGMMSSEGAQIGASWNRKSQHELGNMLAGSADRWYQSSGRLFRKPNALADDWAETLKACEGIIAFDAVLCRGPRHDVSNIPPDGVHSQHETWLRPALATVALGPSGCATCRTSPEGPAIFDVSPMEDLPLLDPPPLHSPSIRQAQRPPVSSEMDYKIPPLFARCERCLEARWCERCNVWWDELCYPGREIGARTPEVSETSRSIGSGPPQFRESIKVHMGLCTEHCLVGEMMSGAGGWGMWG